MTDPTPDVPTLRRLLAEATPGPWVHSDVLPGHVYARRIFGDVIVGAPRNATCAAAAVSALPGILDRLEAAEGAVARVKALADLKDAEFVRMNAIPDPLTGRHSTMRALVFVDNLRAALAEVTP